jgi:hypothetical protein
MSNVFNIVTGYGQHVMLDAERVMAALGAYGLRFSLEGNIEALMVTPEGTTWEDVESLPAVLAGQTTTRAKKN